MSFKKGSDKIIKTAVFDQEQANKLRYVKYTLEKV